MLALCGFASVTFAYVPPPIAHQSRNISDVEVMIHLEPDDFPYAGKPTQTWFMLTRRNGEMIAPSSCNCRIAAYDSRNQAIARQLPLSTMAIEGHKKDHQALQTNITFPKPGSYKVVVSGQAKDESFAPFEFSVPVNVRP
jgi:hypothetical protein